MWLLASAFGVALTAAGWDEEVGGSTVMTAIVLLNVIDDIIMGVPHRWPAALTAVALLTVGSRLTGAALPGSLGAAWAETIATAVGVTLAFAATATVTRLPQRPAASAHRERMPPPGIPASRMPAPPPNGEESEAS